MVEGSSGCREQVEGNSRQKEQEAWLGSALALQVVWALGFALGQGLR